MPYELEKNPFGIFTASEENEFGVLTAWSFGETKKLEFGKTKVHRYWPFGDKAIPRIYKYKQISITQNQVVSVEIFFGIQYTQFMLSFLSDSVIN